MCKLHCSSSFDCPVFKKLRQSKIEKANKLKPKPISFEKPISSFSEAVIFDMTLPPVSNLRPTVPSKPVVASKRLRDDDGPVLVENVVEMDVQKEIANNNEVFNDLKTVLSSQINEDTVVAVKPFFEGVVNLLSGVTTLNSQTQDSLKTVFASILSGLNNNEDLTV